MDFSYNYTYPKPNTYNNQIDDEENEVIKDELMSFERINHSQDTFRDDELLKEDEPENYRIYGYDDDDLPLANSITEGLRAKVLPFDYTPQNIERVYKEFDIEQQQQPFFKYCKIRTKNGDYKPSHILFDIATKLYENTDKWGEDEKSIMGMLKPYNLKYDRQSISKLRTSKTFSMLQKGFDNKEILEELTRLDKTSKKGSHTKHPDAYIDSDCLNDFERRYSQYAYEFNNSDKYDDDYDYDTDMKY